MTLPAVTKTWIISPNNRITFVSLVDTMARYLFGVKAFLKTNGYTVVGSSDGVTAGMDGPGTDRWDASSDAGIRGTVAAAPQSWIILRDGNGADILITFQGAGVSPTGDNIARISFSPGQLFVIAGTPTHQPTATDEQVVTSATDLIQSTASYDRIWYGWVSSDQKFCRFAVARGGAWCGRSWGIENFTHALVAPAAISPVVWGFAITTTSSGITSGVAVGVSRVTVSAVPFNCVVHFGMEFFANNPNMASAFIPELQSTGFLVFPLSIASVTANARGKLGNVIDQWVGTNTAGAGSTYGLLQFIAISGYLGNNNSGMWPWDGVTTPIMY